MEKRKISILDVVRQSISGNFSPEVKNIIKRGQDLAKQANIPVSDIVLPMEARAITAGQSGLINDEVLWDFVSPIRNESVLVKAGAKFVPNCVSNFKVPTFNGVKVTWEAENDTAGDGSNTFGAVDFTPKRLTASVIVSRQLLTQTAGKAEQLITSDITQAINAKIEETVFGAHAAADKIPSGFFTGVADEDLFTSGVINTGKLLDMAYSLTNAGQDSRAYIINETGEKYFKKYLDSTRSKYVLEGGKIWEYPVFVTNNIPSGLTTDEAQHGIIFGNWSQYILAGFEVLDVVIDPYSKATAGAVEITVNSYWDFKPRNAGAFAVGAFTVS